MKLGAISGQKHSLDVVHAPNAMETRAMELTKVTDGASDPTWTPITTIVATNLTAHDAR